MNSVHRRPLLSLIWLFLVSAAIAAATACRTGKHVKRRR